MNTNPVELAPARLFFATASGEVIVVHETDISPALSKAYDVIEEYLVGPPPEHWLTLLVAAEKTGDDPVALAKKLCTFNRVLRTPGGNP